MKTGEDPETHQAPCRTSKYWVLLKFGSLFIALCYCQGSLRPQTPEKQRNTQPAGCGWSSEQHWSPRTSLCLKNVHPVPCVSQLRVGTDWSQSSTPCCISFWRQAHKGSQKGTIPLQNLSCLHFFSIFSSVRVENFS